MKNTRKQTKETILMCEEMRLAPKQHGCRGIPATTGDTALLLNMRRSPGGSIESVPMPKSLGELEGEYAGCDVSEGTRHIFMRRGPILYHEASIGKNGEWSRIRKPICSIGETTGESAACAGYVVLRLKEGSLFYIKRESGSYIPLGNPPEAPLISVEKCQASAYSRQTDPITFRKTTSDMRPGVPDEIAAQVSDSIREAYSLLGDDARAEGRFFSPRIVCAGIRLRDGSLLGMSEPQRVPGTGWQGSTPVRFALKRQQDSTYTGTLAAAVSLEGYKIKVSFAKSRLEEWKDIVKGYEIYVGEGTDHPCSEKLPAIVSYSSGDDSLRCRLRLPPEILLEDALAKGKMRLAAEAEITAEEIIVDSLAIPGKELPSSPSPSAPPAASAIAGHGQFLHIAGEEKIATMSYGNPFVAACVTDTGANASALAAQPSGGGAYTRQYIYIFTPGNILALTHDMQGRHRNLRQISGEGVSEAKRVAIAPDAVWALTDNGSLLEIKDSRVKRHITGLEGYGSLACDFRLGQLWISPDDDSEPSIACSIADPLRASMRSFSGGLPLPGNGLAAFLTRDPRSSERRMAMIPDHPEGNAAGNRNVWLTREAEIPEGRTAVEVQSSRPGSSARITAGTSGTLQPKVLAEAFVSSGSPLRSLRIPLTRNTGFRERILAPVSIRMEGELKSPERAVISRF